MDYSIMFKYCLLVFVLLVVIFPCFSISCDSTKVYLKVSKQSKNFASEESYEIWGNGVKVANNPALANNELQTFEYCINPTTNNQYTLKMKDSYGGSWSSGSWISIEGIYGNHFYKGFLTDSREEEIPLSLYYGIMKNAEWRLTSSSVSGNWLEYDYGDSSWAQVTLGSVTETTSGAQYFRKTFTGLANMAAYELSMNYRYGIVAYVNGKDRKSVV